MNTRTIRAGLAAVALALGAAACQPLPHYVPAPPPADAIVVPAHTGDAVFVEWSVGSLYCTGTVTVVDADTGAPVWTATGGPATGSVFLTPTHDGRLAGWIRSSDPSGRHRRCVTTLELIPSV